MSKITRRKFLNITAISLTLPFYSNSLFANTQNKITWEGITLGSQANMTLFHNNINFARNTLNICINEIIRLEKIFSLSGSIKINKGYSKYLLRKATKNIVPEEIRLRRDKVGYATPEIAWLKKIQHELFESIPNEDDAFIQYRKLKKDWFKIINTTNDPSRLWRIINFMKWKESLRGQVKKLGSN